MTDCEHLNQFCKRCTLSNAAFHASAGLRCSGREAGLSLVALRVCTFYWFLFGKQRQSWVFSQLEMGGGGVWSGSEFTMMAAVCFMNVSHTHSHTLSITDKRPCQTPPASSTPVQIHVETNIFNLFLIYKKKKPYGNAYISIFHTANNQTSDHYLILIYYSRIRNCHPVQSQTFLEFNSYQKYSLCGHNLRTIMTAYKHRSLLLGRELTSFDSH